MKFSEKKPPREFTINANKKGFDCAHIDLEAGEQVTFTTKSGGEYDVAKTPWGFYATPSLNVRLPQFGLRGVLVKNPAGRLYVLLVEKDQEALFLNYLKEENSQIITWLDKSLICPFCQGTHFKTVFSYNKPPSGEILFQLKGNYKRDLMRCEQCSHFLSVHTMDLTNLYSGEYVNATYGDEEGLKKNFERVINLPPEKSDNTGRVKRMVSFAEKYFKNYTQNKPKVLDVGSGLCVFLHEIKKQGWDTVALDPDPRNIAHAQGTAGVNAILGDLTQLKIKDRFDVITLNKVLEHIPDPVSALKQTQNILAPGGMVYIELPDGEMASGEGFGREEFFIDHHHVFSMASLTLLAQKAGYLVLKSNRIREPSTKFTLYAFLALA